VPGAAVAAVHDPVAERAAAVGHALGVPVANVPEILADPDVDAVLIASSTDTHADLTVAAAGAGKAILCEKPISLDLAEVDRALAAVARAGVLYQVGFNRRFDPSNRAVRDAVLAGEVGQPHLVRITSRDPAPPSLDYLRASGGIFLDMTIHDFDLARFLIGSEVVEVFAAGTVRVLPDLVEIGDVDTATAVLRHADDTLTVIDNSRQAVYGFDQRVEVHGSAGLAASENAPAHTAVVRTAQGSHGSAFPYFFLERYVPSYLAQWEAFVAAVRAGGPSPVGPEDGRAPLVIGLAAWRSLRERRPVLVEELACVSS